MKKYLLLLASLGAIGTMSAETFYMDEPTVNNPKSEYLSRFGYVELSYGGQALSLVKIGGQNEDGYYLSSTPVTLKIAADKDYTYAVYPYIDGVGQNPDIASFEIGTTRAGMEDVLYINFAPVLERLQYIWPVGTYNVIIPEGIVKNVAGAVNPAQTITFHLMREAQDGGKVTPPYWDEEMKQIDYKPEQLDAVTLNWNAPIEHVEGAENIKVINELGKAEDAILLFGEEVKIENNQLVLDLSGMVPGYWTVIIPDGYLIIDGEYLSFQQNMNYHIISGETDKVEDLDASAGHFSVYSLGGIHLLETDSADALKSLAPGVYVVNGKKYLVM